MRVMLQCAGGEMMCRMAKWYTSEPSTRMLVCFSSKSYLGLSPNRDPVRMLRPRRPLGNTPRGGGTRWGGPSRRIASAFRTRWSSKNIGEKDHD